MSHEPEVVVELKTADRLRLEVRHQGIPEVVSIAVEMNGGKAVRIALLRGTRGVIDPRLPVPGPVAATRDRVLRPQEMTRLFLTPSQS